jgi:WD40 repeat protein
MHHSTQIWVLNLRTGKQYNNGNWKDISPINDTKFIPSTHLLMFCDTGNNIYHWNVVEQNCEMWSHIDYSFSRLAIPHSDSWMLLNGLYGLFICDRSRRRAREVVGLPWLPNWEAIAISFDDQAIACGFFNEIWILDANTLLADEKSATQDTYREFHISDNGQLIAYDLGRNVEVWDVLTGDMLCSLTLDDVNHPSIHNITFAPKDRYLLVSGLQSILGWDLDDESSQRVSGDFGSGPIAVSDNGYNGDRWAAARQSMGDVSVWNLTTLKQNRIFRQPDNPSQEAVSMAFTGNQLGILWNSKKGLPRTSPFLLYDVCTGQQLSGINFLEYYDGTRLSLFNKPKLKLFLSGTWVMFHPGPNTSLFFLKMSTDGNTIEVRNKFWHVSLLDDSTVSTDQGVFHLSLAGSSLSKHSEIDTVNRFGLARMSQEAPGPLSITFSEYAYYESSAWIRFDGRPLLWRNAQYWEGVIAIGHDYIMLQSSNGLDFIRFAKDADKVLRQAIKNLT